MEITEAIAKRTLKASRTALELRTRRKQTLSTLEESVGRLYAIVRSMQEIEGLSDQVRSQLEAELGKSREDAEIEADHSNDADTLATLALNFKEVFIRSDSSLCREFLDIVDLPILEAEFERTELDRLLLIEAALQRAILKQRD